MLHGNYFVIEINSNQTENVVFYSSITNLFQTSRTTKKFLTIGSNVPKILGAKASSQIYSKEKKGKRKGKNSKLSEKQYL